MNRHVDFREGNIVKQLILFALPILLGELFQNLYNSADALVIGNYVGKNALASISACEMPASIIIGFFNAMSAGAGVVVSRFFGKDDDHAVKTATEAVLSFSIPLGVSLSAAAALCAPYMLRLSNVDALLFPEACLYLRIYMSGLMFTVIYNMAAGLIRAVGDSSTPFYILVAACCINILLDVLFVKVLAWGVAGAGAATIAAQGISAALACRKLRRLHPALCIRLRFDEEKKGIVRDVLKIGVPVGLQSSLINVSNLFVWRYINTFSPAVIAGYGAAYRVNRFIDMPCKAFGLTVATFVSQNACAANGGRGRAGCVRCMLVSLSTVSVLIACVCLSAERLIALFNSDPAVIQSGVQMLSIVTPMYVVMAAREVFAGILRGHGNTRVPMLLTLIGMVGVRQLFLSIAMRMDYCIQNVYYCFPVTWCVTAAFIASYYFYCRKQLWSACASIEELR